MATYVFENMTQAQANAFAGTDILAFATTTATASNLSVAIGATTDQLQTITLTVGTKSLVFSSSALSQASDGDRLVFNDGSSLILGTNTADTTLTGNANAAGDTVYLFAGNDVYTATAGPSTIFASTGNDTVTAGAGSSNLFGGNGLDSLTGGAGNDHIYGQSASGGTDGADTIVALGGNDYINGNMGDDTIDGGTGSDRIFGGADNDSIAGSAGNDTVNGNLGNDTIDGGADNDSIRGGQGDDSLSGGADSDFLIGDLGNDTVAGGTGTDFVTGGDGNDVFSFASGDATIAAAVNGVTSYDTVNDYVDGQDLFRLSGGTLGTAAGDVLLQASGASFTTVSAATVYAQQLLDGHAGFNDVAVVKVGGDTYLFYDKDGTATGDGTIDSIIKIQGVTDVSLFTVADFAG